MQYQVVSVFARIAIIAFVLKECHVRRSRTRDLYRVHLVRFSY